MGPCRLTFRRILILITTTVARDRQNDKARPTHIGGIDTWRDVSILQRPCGSFGESWPFEFNEEKLGQQAQRGKMYIYLFIL